METRKYLFETKWKQFLTKNDRSARMYEASKINEGFSKGEDVEFSAMFGKVQGVVVDPNAEKQYLGKMTKGISIEVKSTDDNAKNYIEPGANLFIDDKSFWRVSKSDNSENNPSEAQDYDITINHAVVYIGNSEHTYHITGKLDADVIDEILSDIDAYDDSGNNSVRLDCELKTEQGSIDMSITYMSNGDLEGVDLDDRELAAEQGIKELDIINYLNGLF